MIDIVKTQVLFSVGKIHFYSSFFRTNYDKTMWVLSFLTPKGKVNKLGI